ncbi:hypothetical protein E1A91_D01G166300v1, partial [Gossypium mustelinum]
IPGPLGILQALADGTKLLFKENILPSRGNTRLFSIGPAIVVISILLIFSVILFSSCLILPDLNISIFLWIAISSIAPVGLLMSGYRSNNKYSFLGGLRAAAQSISYEIPLILCVLPISLQLSGRKRKRKKFLPQDGLISQSSLKRAQKINRIEFSLSFVWIPIHVLLNKQGIEQKMSGWLGTPKYIKDCSSTVDIGEAQSKYHFWGWNLWRQPIGFIIFILASLAECERLPFDLPEVEDELVAGYQTEYSGIKFGLFYIAFYLNLLLSLLFVTVLYLGVGIFPFR